MLPSIGSTHFTPWRQGHTYCDRLLGGGNTTGPLLHSGHGSTFEGSHQPMRTLLHGKPWDGSSLSSPALTAVTPQQKPPLETALPGLSPLQQDGTEMLHAGNKYSPRATNNTERRWGKHDGCQSGQLKAVDQAKGDRKMPCSCVGCCNVRWCPGMLQTPGTPSSWLTPPSPGPAEKVFPATLFQKPP